MARSRRVGFRVGPVRLTGCSRQPKVLHCVTVTDAADERAEQRVIRRQFTRFHIAPDQLTEDAAKVFVPRITHERARVRNHAHEPRQQPEIRERVHLPFHAVLLIQKPPPAAELDFARDAAVLEIAEHGAEHVVIRRIEIVKNGAGQCVFGFEPVQKRRQRPGLWQVAHGIKAGVATELAQRPGVVVALRAQVQLHHPTFLGVESADEEHEMRGKLGVFRGRNRPARAGFAEDGFDHGFGAEIRERLFQSVIGHARPPGRKEIVAALQRVAQGVERPDVHVRGGRQFVHPGVPRRRLVNSQRGIGTERGLNLGWEIGPGNARVIPQIIRGIIRGADDLDFELVQDAVGAQGRRGEAGVGAIPDFLCRVFIEQIVDAEVTFQLQMRPVIKGIAERMRHGFRPSHEFFKRRGGAGAEAFGRAVGPHRAPFVVVALQPNLEKIMEPAILRHVAGGEMTVIITNRLGGGEAVIQSARRTRAQEKIIVDERLHPVSKPESPPARQAAFWSPAELRPFARHPARPLSGEGPLLIAAALSPP